MFLSLFSVVKSADSNEVISYSYTSEKLESFQIKSGGTKIESRSSILKPSLVENEPSSQLVWSSKDMFIILGGGANKSLFIFRRALDNEVEPILIKKLASVSAYDVISKESGEFFLVFAEHHYRNHPNLVSDMLKIRQPQYHALNHQFTTLPISAAHWHPNRRIKMNTTAK